MTTTSRYDYCLKGYNMQNYVILTDSGSDLTRKIAEEVDVAVIDLTVMVEGSDPVKDSEMDVKELYAKLRDKKKASTSAINIDEFTAVMIPYLEQGKDILYLGFSSGLSSTFSAGKLAAEELGEKYPERKIYAVDTLCASLGEGLLVYLAAKKRLAGESIETVRDYVEGSKLNLCHWFTVDDLFFLKRGGRVSATTAVVGTVLGIKPVMHVDNEGKLVKTGIARGRKASIDALFDKIKTTILGDPKEATVFISHGDCEDDANYLADRIKKVLEVKDIVIGYVGSVIGSHSGPGTLALFYLGAQR